MNKKGVDNLASYTNNVGEKIEVTDEHIETSIRIKVELQNSSPSGKCNWRLHKELMEKENYYDSENSERYRQFIKEQQSRKGILPSNKKYAEFLSDKKIESLRNMVSESYIANRERQNINRLLNKTKREIADEGLVIDELKSQISQLEIISFKPEKVKNVNKEVVGLVTPSDWHIGLLFNGLDYSVAQRRVVEYARIVLERSKLFGINKLYVANLGDVVNHIYMHKNTQAYYSEFDVATQIVKATNLMFSFLNYLSRNMSVEYLGTIVGNHGRMSSKGETLTNDSVEVVVHEMLKSLIESNKNTNLSYDDSGYRKSFISANILGNEIVMVHGDKESKTGADRIKKHSSILNKQVKILIQGHVHNFKVESENYDRKAITSGSLMGSDDYAQDLGFHTGASQLFTVVHKDYIIPMEINLNHIV